MSEGSGRNDRVLPLTRVIAAVVILILILAVYVLYFNPSATADSFAWTITPSLTAMAMGAGYLMGIYFFLRVLTASRWHTVAAGFLPITGFTIMMALATIVHLNRFHLGAWNFLLWSLIYAITPFLVPFLWWLNQKRDPRILAPNERIVPPLVRHGARLIGLILLVASLLTFVWPDPAISVFPWKLTPLTARVVAGWAVLPGIGGLVLAQEARWSGWQVLLESFMVGLLFFALAIPRGLSDLTPGSIGPGLLLIVVVGGLIAALALYLAMQWRRTPTSTVSEERA